MVMQVEITSKPRVTDYLSSEQEEQIRNAFLTGTLKTLSINRETNEINSSRISDVLRHERHGKLFRVRTSLGREVEVTGDHSLFRKNEKGRLVEITVEELTPGKSSLMVVDMNFDLIEDLVVSVEMIERPKYTYDLSVPGNENFVLANGVLAHNSYSIGGVSLDLCDKSGKYLQVADNWEELFNNALANAKKAAGRITKGLSQNLYGTGGIFHLGPFSKSGVIAIRNFL